MWKNIYTDRIRNIQDRKIAEFNFKLLHRILPCGRLIANWNVKVSQYCDFCGETETVEHMIFSCRIIQEIWNMVNSVLKVTIQYRHNIIGFVNHLSTDLSHCITIVAYCIIIQTVVIM